MSAGWIFRSTRMEDRKLTTLLPLGSEIMGMGVADDQLKVLWRAKRSAMDAFRDDQMSNSEVRAFRYIDEDEEVSVADMRRLRYINWTDRYGGIKYLYEEMPVQS